MVRHGLCTHCQRVINTAVFPPNGSRSGSVFRKPLHRDKWEIYQDVQSVIRGAEAGCWLCGIIVQKARHQKKWEMAFPYFDFKYIRPDGGDDPGSTFRINVFGGNPNPGNHIIDLVAAISANANTSPFPSRVNPCFYLFGRLACLLRKFLGSGTRKHARSSTWSNESLAQVERWLSVCDNVHQHHHPLEGPFEQPKLAQYPTRLLDVRESLKENIRLVETNRMSGVVRYATLSHCWGKCKEGRLLTHLLPAFCQQIDLMKLPQTFRDAVQVCRDLEISYLWIDSMCIIQDSTEDWNAEAPRMAQIYSSSFVTIAATASRDDNEGLFRSIDPLTDIAFSAISTKRWRRKRSFRIYEEGGWRVHVDNAPLNQRAWVFQERFLSARVLHFADTQIYWQCPNLSTSEFDPENVAQDTPDRFQESFMPVGLQPGEMRPANTLNNNDQVAQVAPFHSQWEGIVHKYSDLGLTFSSDRLLAISGIARRMHQIHGLAPGGYLAGLWYESLPTDILWFAYAQNKPKLGGFPSWSWASIDGAIRPYKYTDRGTEMIRILHASTALVGDAFGSVTAGRLIIQGYLCEIEFTLEPWKGIGRARVFLNGKPVHFGENMKSEFDQSVPFVGHEQKIRVHFLPVFLLHDRTLPDHPHFIGLMLQSTDQKKGQYIRVGRFIVKTLPVCDLFRTTFSPRSTSRDYQLGLGGNGNHTVEII